MNANAPSFGLSVKMGTARVPDTVSDDSFNDALLRALVHEKEKNRAAKLALDAAHREITLLSVENKTLKAAKTLLEAIVKKNGPQPLAPIIQEPAQEPVQSSILYDALAHQRKIYETQGHPEENHPEETKPDTYPFDLSLVPAISGDNAIFRHFLDDIVEEESPQSPLQPAQEEDERRLSLVDISPLPHQPPSSPKPLPTAAEAAESFPSPKPLPTITEAVENLSSLKPLPTVAEAVESCHRALKSAFMGTTLVDMDKAPTLKLPADFLAKYRPVKKTPVVVVKESPEEEFPQTDETDLHGSAKSTPPVAEPEVKLTPDAVPETKLMPTMGPQASPKKLVRAQTNILPNGLPLGAMRVPILNVNIKWAMNSLAPVFTNENEVRRARQSTSGNSNASYFWRHPVRFSPNATEKNLYRTVMVDYIPPHATYQDVLEHVRTGALESIELFPPIGGCTKYMTARVVFVKERPATTMAMQYQKAIDQGDPIKIKGWPVRFWQVLQPTYPANKQTENDIFEDGYTRILLLENVENSGILPRLHEKILQEMSEGSVIKIWRTTDGVPMVEFNSVKAAAGAYRRLKADKEFKECIFDFDWDYCEDAYES